MSVILTKYYFYQIFQIILIINYKVIIALLYHCIIPLINTSILFINLTIHLC